MSQDNAIRTGHFLASDADSAELVGDFVKRAKQQIENVSAAWIIGEVANFTCATSGHWYFVIRDEVAQVDCVMLVRDNRAIAVMPTNGDKVLLLGRPTVYVPRGRFQLSIKLLRFDGVGHLHQLFMQRKKAWQAQGWFATERKTTPPFLPSRVGVICSLTGAAVYDVLRTLKTRMPSISVILYPAPAQGLDAAEKIGAAITAANQRQECDVLLVCRGGGGMEDLWAYNEEAVVAAIVHSSIPIISGIGHEVDETLADYAADVRAATPTAAAARAVPEARYLQQQLQDSVTRLRRLVTAFVDERGQRLDWATRFIAVPENLLAEKTACWQQGRTALLLAMQQPLHRLSQRLMQRSSMLRVPDMAVLTLRLDVSTQRLQRAMKVSIEAVSGSLQRRQVLLQTLSPKRALARGYSIVHDQEGRVVTNANTLQLLAEVKLTFHHGTATALVKKRQVDTLL